MATESRLADPPVSRAKFEREVAEYRVVEAEYRRRGWFLVEAKFPTVFLVLTAAHVQPAPVLFGVEFDFTDYDLIPLGVTLVDPFSREPYRAKELPTVLPRLVGEGGAPLRQDGLEARIVEDGGQAPIKVGFGQLMMWHDLEEVPFLCLAGVRAYHEHPAHTGDSWMLHRHRGTGRMAVLLEHLHRFGVQTVSGYAVEAQLQTAGWRPPGAFQIQARVSGLAMELRPE